ncbi:hypothetical protein PAXINDRAFT_100882 [Paxillus involutus ATCC 200175]|uniref:Uncharacterized protein n=1 Tax=Paxillus involutus ATCC 200175 TaxID=664439 RepID=A0A0C9TZS8_PAXIN|nr:hypothetical protein PAXINDRAFT_100882 [Paxillus involutus ATCC 200175]
MALRVRKPPSASNTAPLSAIPSISSPHVDPDGASAPAPLFNQSRPAIVITSPSDTTKVPVHLSASSTSSSQTPSPPAQVLVSPASTGTNIDVDGAASEIEPNPRWLTDTERVDQASPSTERMEPLPTSASHSVTIQLTLSLHHGRGHNVMGVPALAPIPLSNQAASDIAITSPMNTTDVLVQVHPSASAPASIPLSNQSRPAIVITSLVNTTEVPVHPSAIPPSPSQTSPPPVQALLASASVDPNTDLDGPPSEIEPNPWQLTDTERVDLVSVECMAQLNLEDPWRNP